MDALYLSRVQFAITTMFHILFPALTIGLSLYLVVVEFLWLVTKQELYYRMYRFWAKIFAINFAVGAVSGIVLEFEFGTNFSRFSQAVSNVFSPLLAFEVLTAFPPRSFVTTPSLMLFSIAFTMAAAALCSPI